MRPKISVNVGAVGKAMREAVASLLTDKAGWRRNDFEAFDAFYKLVSKGCEGVFLVSMLTILAEENRADSWKGLTGFSNPDKLRTGLKRLRVCADDIERLLGGVIGNIFQKPAELSLPDNLRGFAGRLELVLKSITPRINLVDRLARAAIVRHVHDKTGSFNDELVASILSPALGRCDAVNHAQWRSENAHLITLLRRK